MFMGSKEILPCAKSEGTHLTKWRRLLFLLNFHVMTSPGRSLLVSLRITAVFCNEK
jgi:hypothetical protein